MKKCPVLFAVLGLVTIVLAIEILPGIIGNPYEPLELGIREAAAAVFILIVYCLFAGTRDLKPKFKGFGYDFRVLLYMFIILGVFATSGIITRVKSLSGTDSSSALLNLLNSLIACLFVGIVEEFTFRAMIFGGLASCFGRTKKGVLWAAVISGIIFGFIHVAPDMIFNDSITLDAFTIAQAAGKTLQAGLMGIVFAILYFKTRSIWAIALIHSLNDFALFLLPNNSNAGSYLTNNIPGMDEFAKYAPIVIYAVFSLLVVPALVRSVRELKKEETPYVLPLDDEFLPRAVTYRKK